MTTFAPFSANNFAVAKPKPRAEAAPVIMATLSFNNIVSLHDITSY
ncbi:hypothetical protein UUU_12160 [Klebsiella pneumoniae subsp. pneumoniae DSM 30104 = JCM 1662 = NBRC 14940]|nr:hypothetical protein UUU_12160 [Klebsiella pneumoniae subsp. pneumoniae DSM 30104 = JCM 1662 = NBRC 14940]